MIKLSAVLNRAKAEISHNRAVFKAIFISLRIIAKDFAEVTGFADVIAKVTGKSLQESGSVSDNTANEIDKPKSETVSLTEQTPKNVNKPKQDSAALTEAHIKTHGKNRQEAISLIDIQTQAVGKGLGELPQVTDALAFEAFKSVAEQAILADRPSKGTVKPFADTAGFTDSFLIARLFLQAFPESPSVSDVAQLLINLNKSDQAVFAEQISLAYAKLAADSAGIGDEIGIAVSKGLTDATSVSESIDIIRQKVLSEAGLLSDNQSMGFHKFITEGLFATDDLDGEATAQDDQEMSFVKVRSDLAIFSDNVFSTQGKSKSDTIGSTDSGSLRGQGYAEFGYFLEDYVGYSRNF